jgi:hypothetical protein
MTQMKNIPLTAWGLPARYAVLENELYVAVKVSDIDKLIFTDGKVVYDDSGDSE